MGEREEQEIKTVHPSQFTLLPAHLSCPVLLFWHTILDLCSTSCIPPHVLPEYCCPLHTFPDSCAPPGIFSDSHLPTLSLTHVAIPKYPNLRCLPIHPRISFHVTCLVYIHVPFPILPVFSLISRNHLPISWPWTCNFL